MRPADPVDLPGIRAAHDPQQQFVSCRRIPGKSSARKYAPFDVPPRIIMHRTPASPGAIGRPLASGGDVLDAAGGQLVAQAAQVQAELAVGQGLAALRFLGHPGLRGR